LKSMSGRGTILRKAEQIPVALYSAQTVFERPAMDLPDSLLYNFRMETIVSSNGRITIPTIRHRLGIREGTHIVVDVDEAKRKIILTPITQEYIHFLRGKYKGRGLMKTLITEKRREMN
jgi:AbrB family looped-hinge helix DNA binding protein